MKRADEKSHTNKPYRSGLHSHQIVDAGTDIEKKRWIQKYSQRILKQWLRRQSSLGVARTYAEQIEKDLARFYDNPLKKIFIETTYH
jgi:hypothetical protein